MKSKSVVKWTLGVIAVVALLVVLKQDDDRRRLAEYMTPNPGYVDPGLTTQVSDYEPDGSEDPSENPHWAPDYDYRPNVVRQYQALQAYDDSLNTRLKKLQHRRASAHAVDVVFYEDFIVCNVKESLFHAMTHEERDSVCAEPGLDEFALDDKVQSYESTSEFEEVDGFWPTMNQVERDSVEARTRRNLLARNLLPIPD